MLLQRKNYRIGNKLKQYKMAYKKNITDSTTVTRDLKDVEMETGNIYKSLAIISKRANQISLEIKEELTSKLSEFSSNSDNLEEVFENREQIEVSKHYEKMPKPVLIAIQEYMDGEIQYKSPVEDK
jgi:DNA-directed RNA polymerase subunit K/omega